MGFVMLATEPRHHRQLRVQLRAVQRSPSLYGNDAEEGSSREEGWREATNVLQSADLIHSKRQSNQKLRR